MEKSLVRQASAMPTRKLSAATIGAAVASVAGLIVRNVWPDWYDPDAWLTFTPIIVFAVGYFVRDEDNTP